MTLMLRSDPVDVKVIAERLGVQVDTVHTWRKRTKRGEAVGMPDNRWEFSNVPVWDWLDVLVWAGRSGRLAHASGQWKVQYAELAGAEPEAERLGGRMTAEERAALAKPVRRRRRVAS